MEYIKIYAHYKKEYSGNVIIVRIQNHYYAWLDDCDIVGRADHWRGTKESSEYRFHHSRLPEVLENIEQPVTFVEYRDESGEFSLPDLDEIIQNINDDY